MSNGSNVPFRSRGVASVSSPMSPWTVFFEWPFRRLRTGLAEGSTGSLASDVSWGAFASPTKAAASPSTATFRLPKCTSSSASSTRSITDFIIIRIIELKSC